MDLPGRIARLIGGEVDRKPGDLLGRAEPAHGLAVDESLAHRLKALARSLGLVGDALVEGRRLDRAGACLNGAEGALEVDRGQSVLETYGRCSNLAEDVLPRNA